VTARKRQAARPSTTRKPPAAPSPKRIRPSLLEWYRARRRDLPWRRTSDPYAIWVSEIMLQQTRVETVITFYERFLDRFPSVTALAGAREEDVLAAWSGLGYYRRARGLHAAAAIVAREHAGSFPDDAERLRALPGIGDYTAAAIASIAFGREAAAVDGNVVRVLARIHGLTGSRDSALLKREVTLRAQSLARGPSPGDWTQALMELGATVCMPRDPRCDECPVVRFCDARRSGDPARYPEPARKPNPRSAGEVLLLARRGRSIYLEQAATRTGMAWTLPRAGTRAAAVELGFELRAGGPLTSFRHRTYSEDLRIDVCAATARRGTRRAKGRWFDPEALDQLPLRAPTLKAIKRLRLRNP
jgi:A/G-specific adenine glycosylase